MPCDVVRNGAGDPSEERQIDRCLGCGKHLGQCLHAPFTMNSGAGIVDCLVVQMVLVHAPNVCASWS